MEQGRQIFEPVMDPQTVELYRQAAAATNTPIRVYQGQEDAEVARAGQIYHDYAEAWNAHRQAEDPLLLDGSHHLTDRPLDPEGHRQTAERALRAGGALVVLVEQSSGSVEPFRDTLQRLQAETEQS